MSTHTQATVEDLYRHDGKAELVHGELVPMSPTGRRPNRAAGAIYVSLRRHEGRAKEGVAFSDNMGFIVDLPQRRSFSSDAAWYVGEDSGMKFQQGAPRFAAEVRSENDYGPLAEREMADKRRDYFAAGTLVVWDVDLLSDDVVRVYRSTDPEHPTVYHRGQVAESEPAVPGWSMPVDELFT